MPKQFVIRVLLAGPIKFWWDDNWDLPLHWHYDAWREFISEGLVKARGFLIYRPHHAFKGDWTEEAQVVNDAALKMADVVVVMTPPGVPSEGTDGEVLLASSSGAVIVYAPPPATKKEFRAALARLVKQLRGLHIERALLEQATILESIGYSPNRDWMVRGLIREYKGHVLRVHYNSSQRRLVAGDFSKVSLRSQKLTLVQDKIYEPAKIPLPSLHKIEVLERLVV